MEILKNYWPLILLTTWLTYKWWKARKIKAMLPDLRKEGAIFIDVRSQAEFASGNAPGTINIPLNEINGRINEIPRNKPVVLCCASGTRSGMAKMILHKSGFAQVYNIGTWTKFLG